MKHANVALFVPHEGCPHGCSFCNQNIITGRRGEDCTPELVTRTAEQALHQMGEERASQAEIAFFGGSFTAIEEGRMESLLRAAYPYVANGSFAGIRVSTRPDCVEEKVLALLKNYGVTAVELGAQSMSDEVLRRNGRGHTAQTVEEASRRVKSFGFSLGLQMMTGLWGDHDEGGMETAVRLAGLFPDTVRIYPTVVLRDTPLHRAMERGEYRPQTLEEAVVLCASLLRLFHRRGIEVIRVGLQASPQLEEDYVAGPYHPAFRELCEGELYYHFALDQLRGRTKGKYTLWVRKRDLSQMIGQKKHNLIRLQREGYDCRVRPLPGEGDKYTLQLSKE